jgi:septum formation inhibitor-activating ATPase MinD
MKARARLAIVKGQRDVPKMLLPACQNRKKNALNGTNRPVRGTKWMSRGMDGS